MKKYIIKIISAFLSIILIFCALPITSDAYLNDFKADDYKNHHNLPELPKFKYGDFEVEYGVDGLTIANYPDNKTEKVDIPEEINGIPVTEIHDTDVYTDELTIPDSVKRIRDFEPKAKKVNIGNNVETIEGVDLNCVCCDVSELIFPESLKELYIDNTPSGNDSPLKKIVFKGKYQSLSFDYHKYGASNSIKPLAFPDETEIIFEGWPSYDIWYYLTYAGYKLIRNDGEFRFVKYENEQLKTCGDYQYYLDENGDAVISGYIGNESATLNIPAMLDGHKVIKIGDNTFDNRAEIPLEPLKEAAVKESGFAFNEVTIPSTVVEIGNFAFSYCRDLQKVNIPDSVETIGYSAFENCDRLTNVNLPKNLKTICGAAFTHCNLTTVTIPEGTEYIGSYAFYKNFTSEIILADSIEFVGDKVFSNAKITQISMPSSLKYIGKGAFYDCFDLESIILNSGLKEIGNGAFEFSKIKEITIPSSVELIGNHAFFRCDRLRNVIFDDNSKLKTISEDAFAFTRIQEIVIPNSVDYLGPSCFYDVTFLKKIIISDNIKIIGEHLLMCDKEAIEVQKILPFLSDTWPLCRIGRAVIRASQSCRQSCNKSQCPACGCRSHHSCTHAPQFSRSFPAREWGSVLQRQGACGQCP